MRRRQRDEQRAPTYRELVLSGARRPWTEAQVKAARHLSSTVTCATSEMEAWDACGEVGSILCHPKPKPTAKREPRSWRAWHQTYVRPAWQNFFESWFMGSPSGGGEWMERVLPRLRAWAQRVIRETAELEGA